MNDTTNTPRPYSKVRNTEWEARAVLDTTAASVIDAESGVGG